MKSNKPAFSLSTLLSHAPARPSSCRTTRTVLLSVPPSHQRRLAPPPLPLLAPFHCSLSLLFHLACRPFDRLSKSIGSTVRPSLRFSPSRLLWMEYSIVSRVRAESATLSLRQGRLRRVQRRAWDDCKEATKSRRGDGRRSRLPLLASPLLAQRLVERAFY
jgi:hypothetical protein